MSATSCHRQEGINPDLTWEGKTLYPLNWLYVWRKCLVWLFVPSPEIQPAKHFLIPRICGLIWKLPTTLQVNGIQTLNGIALLNELCSSVVWVNSSSVGLKFKILPLTTLLTVMWWPMVRRRLKSPACLKITTVYELSPHTRHTEHEVLATTFQDTEMTAAEFGPLASSGTIPLLSVAKRMSPTLELPEQGSPQGAEMLLHESNVTLNTFFHLRIKKKNKKRKRNCAVQNVTSITIIVNVWDLFIF